MCSSDNSSCLRWNEQPSLCWHGFKRCRSKNIDTNISLTSKYGGVSVHYLYILTPSLLARQCIIISKLFRCLVWRAKTNFTSLTMIKEVAGCRLACAGQSNFAVFVIEYHHPTGLNVASVPVALEFRIVPLLDWLLTRVSLPCYLASW